MTLQQKKRWLLIAFLALLLTHLSAYTQYTQTIRGRVTDQVLQRPLAGATVTLNNTGHTVISDSDGQFRIPNIPVGSWQVTVSHTGYQPSVVEHIIVNSGKEVVLNISLELDVALQQVEVVAKTRKNRPLNDMSMVSARAFTVEETQKYAAAVNDPLRMATSFAGVVSADDGNNEIVIRGNSPAGLLWRMEGVDIPNPNHFSMAGSSGGGISILSSQLLANSDFVTGAFSAEYGNALSGVFDLRLRKGNNEKREYTVQAGLLGLNLAAEGPVKAGYKGSYLVNYRYSTLQLLSNLGLDLGAGGVTNFQDLSFNIALPTRKAGDFTIFGFGGLSSQDFYLEKDPSKWETEGDRYGGNFKANTGAIGLTHSISLGSSTHLKSSLATSYTDNAEQQDYLQDDGSMLNTYHNSYATRKWIFSSVMNHQLNTRHVLRAGVIANLIGFDYFKRSRENPDQPVKERLNSSDATQTLQAYAQWQYRPVNQLNIQAGIHTLYLVLNNTRSLEPRLSVKYELNSRNTLAFGYGRHSQMQALGVYFARNPDDANSPLLPNKNLGFTKADHWVLSYGHAFSNRLRFKSEVYYQHLSNVPVSIYDSTTFSTVNIRGDYITQSLTNRGTGRNYGIDLSLEKHLSNSLYFLLNHSLYRSRYTAADGIERNTRFNGRYVTNFTGGKEKTFKDGKRTIGANIKLIHAGGFWTTPIDAGASVEKGYAVFREQEAFSVQNPAYFRADLRLSIKWNGSRFTSTLSLDIQNVTNRQNIYDQYFDAFTGEVKNIYQVGIIPVLNYKIDF